VRIAPRIGKCWLPPATVGVARARSGRKRSATNSLPASAGLLVGAIVTIGSPAIEVQDVPPIRQLGAVTAAVADTVGANLTVRVLRGGAVLVNDMSRHRLTLYDSSLRAGRLILDSSGSAVRLYGSGYHNGLLAIAGDSTLFLDNAARAALVIAPSGAIARVTSFPWGPEANPTLDAAAGIANGSLAYTGLPPRIEVPVLGSDQPQSAESDSAPLIRLNLATRRADTLTTMKVGQGPVKYSRIMDTAGYVWSSNTQNPIIALDAWALLSDGTVAVVRTSDYHVDWFKSDGTRIATPPMAHDWHRLTDSEKVALLDSVRRYRVTHPGMQTGRLLSGDGPPKTRSWVPDFIAAEELPDYLPPFTRQFRPAAGAFADADDNIWVQERPVASIDGGPVFAVISRAGVLVDRVQIPGGTSIAGFGPGVVFLQGRMGASGSLARARIR